MDIFLKTMWHWLNGDAEAISRLVFSPLWPLTLYDTIVTDFYSFPPSLCYHKISEVPRPTRSFSLKCDNISNCLNVYMKSGHCLQLRSNSCSIWTNERKKTFNVFAMKVVCFLTPSLFQRSLERNSTFLTWLFITILRIPDCRNLSWER